MFAQPPQSRNPPQPSAARPPAESGYPPSTLPQGQEGAALRGCACSVCATTMYDRSMDPLIPLSNEDPIDPPPPPEIRVWAARLLTDTLVDEIAALASSGAGYDDLAWAAGIAPGTLRVWRLIGESVIGGCGEDGDVEAWGGRNGVEAASARRARSLVLGIERARAEMRIRTLRRIQSQGEDIPAGAPVPALRGSLPALTWVAERLGGYGQPAQAAQPAQASAGVTVNVDVGGLRNRYDALRNVGNARTVDIAPHSQLGAIETTATPAESEVTDTTAASAATDTTPQPRPPAAGGGGSAEAAQPRPT